MIFRSSFAMDSVAETRTATEYSYENRIRRGKLKFRQPPLPLRLHPRDLDSSPPSLFSPPNRDRDLSVRIPQSSDLRSIASQRMTAPATISPRSSSSKLSSPSISLPSTKSVLELGFGSLCRWSKLKGLEGTENGHQEETVEEEKEDITEHSDSMKNTELEENEEKSDEPLDPVNQESLNDEPQANSMEPQAAENPLESPKEDNQEYGADYQDPTPDAGVQEDESDLKEQSTSSDQLTSRRMEVTSNKVGVLIGKGGDTIRTLQYSSGARIQTTRDSEADPDALTRNVELIGSLENINKAERLIKDVIEEAEAGGSPSLVARGFSAHSSGGFGEQVHIQVPNEKVGVSLQTRSGARIQCMTIGAYNQKMIDNSKQLHMIPGRIE
ncbi:hypothetical protein LXL04_000514 [Taraxacum kok-saghyz]